MKFLLCVAISSTALAIPAFAQPTGAGAPSIVYGLTGRDTSAAPHGILSGSRSANIFSPAKYGTKADDTTFGTDVIYRSSTSSGLMTDSSVAAPATSSETPQSNNAEHMNTTATGPIVDPAGKPSPGSPITKGSEIGSSTANEAMDSAPPGKLRER